MHNAVKHSYRQPYQIPSLCRGKMLFRLLILAQAIAILLAFSPGISSDPWFRLGIISLYVHWIALLSLAVLCPLLPQMVSQSLVVRWLVICLVLLLITAGVSLMAWHFSADVLIYYHSATNFVLANLALALVVSLLVGQLMLMHAERARLLAAQSSAELQAFQARIQPHFLFNSLNALAELVHQSPQDAEQALLDLADLFRAAMHAGSLLTLEQELELARKYLALERWRLGDRLQVAWQLPAVLPAVKLPALTLQPLLENAVRYGVEPSLEPVTITVEVSVGKKQLAIILTNPLNAQNARQREQNGIALQNIQARLELLFADKQQFSCRQVQDTFRVKLVLPLLEGSESP
ncbi:histidine kinase [Rheinheimera sp. UJ51]|uniref:sensor histidine kinase n=1 Tax=unclassified Rheinheimera TaxID=115860 RepID=UPI001E2A56E5|nr:MULTISPECIES: histidine kinase [unclassified Rheinheimera]MCC5452643.1 histidine kinase [Rheinheimera sp. UJ51]MCF4010207.1 histidine kinase [Rheinheimera sp. UJ63]